MTSEFTVDQARATLAELRPAIDELIRLRADAAELAAAVQEESASFLGGLPELKAAQARLDELLARIVRAGLEIKGIAPLLLDFPATLMAFRCCSAGSRANPNSPGTTVSISASSADDR